MLLPSHSVDSSSTSAHSSLRRPFAKQIIKIKILNTNRNMLTMFCV